ncbi:phage tail protein [Dyella caseinilytica]|uniref:Phage tail protein n=1 Tax=Dyella caseinilytica TaxID=1849581 RepID=A0ABX7GTA3_9GAMM|nr:tail fiber protein [Dyella caseinilytica]QRN53689.1 phage tail protein [Dyella caseinilytica]GFZ88530.1 microcystin dependent protein [Dyella caseinilytica]
MAVFFIGQIMPTGFGFPPKGWALCNGQLLPIQQNAALFSLIGTQYGGDGIRTFGLPNLQSRVPIGMGTAQDGTLYPLGLIAGAETVSLQQQQMPSHTHPAVGTTATGVFKNPAGALYGNTGNEAIYGTPGTQVVLNPQTLAMAGGGAPHENMQPFLTINYCIALVGVFPSRP